MVWAHESKYDMLKDCLGWNKILSPEMGCCQWLTFQVTVWYIVWCKIYAVKLVAICPIDTVHSFNEWQGLPKEPNTKAFFNKLKSICSGKLQVFCASLIITRKLIYHAALCLFLPGFIRVRCTCTVQHLQTNG